ncbi:MAG: DNA alkylation repair protein [Mycetocola sp.]
MPFADELLGADRVALLLTAVRAAVPAGTALPQLESVGEAVSGTTLRKRTDMISAALQADLPAPYPEFAAVIRSAARADEVGMSGWQIWPVTEAIAQSAVRSADDANVSDALDLLAELTSRLTSEWAIRILLRHNRELALQRALSWTSSPDEHVRRLASEGTRLFLPWGLRVPALAASPALTLPILDRLHADSSEYVRRSVANHLNDLSRDNPDLVLTTAERWLADPAPTTPALVKHALRTLIKRGDPAALAVLGFHPPQLTIDGPHLSSTVIPFGGILEMTATLTNTGSEPAKLAVDYVVHHQRANGTTTPKTFKLNTVTLSPGESRAVGTQHSFRAISTRRYYPGDHAFTLQVNGTQSDAVPFTLELPTD